MGKGCVSVSISSTQDNGGTFTSADATIAWVRRCTSASSKSAIVSIVGSPWINVAATQNGVLIKVPVTVLKGPCESRPE